VIYTTVQFVSIDSTVETLSNGEIDGTYAALFLGGFLLCLEFLGGMRAVSYSDAVQGVCVCVCVFSCFPVFNVSTSFTNTPLNARQ
jgi:Na+/proline symporter